MTDYLSLVVRSGQVNTPPGSYDTVKEWIRHSFLGPDARVLEIGCSTGFVTIELARYTRAACCGIDRHAASIAAAKANVDSGIADRVMFMPADAGRLRFLDGAFTHVVVGGHLPFVPADVRRAHIAEAVRVLRPWGSLLTALYYYRTPPSAALVEAFNRDVGTHLDAGYDRAYWSGLFDGHRLQLEHESRYDVVPADAERMRTYVEPFPPELRDAWMARLRLFNDNGRHLGYFVRVYRKLPADEKFLIQVPRGGIYGRVPA